MVQSVYHILGENGQPIKTYITGQLISFMLPPKDDPEGPEKRYTFQNPPHEIMITAGYLKQVPAVYASGTHKLITNVFEGGEGGECAQKIIALSLGEIIEYEVGVWLALAGYLYTLSDSKVYEVAPKRQMSRALAKGAKLNRKKIKYLTDPGKFPDLTAEEETVADGLEALQVATESIREAEDTILEGIYSDLVTTTEAIDNHKEWP